MNSCKINNVEYIYTKELVFKLLKNDTYSVELHNMTIEEIIVPETYEGKPVTKIDFFGFAGCTLLTNVEIPNSIKSISDGAFAYCPSLTSIYIPKSVTEIPITYFYECKQLAVYCEIKKPLFGYPKGYNKEWFEYVRKVKWNYKK